MNDTSVEELKRGISIADLVERSGLHVEGHGNVLTTAEHDSLRLWIDTNSWFWYSRGVGGDIIDWIEYNENVDYKQAVDILSTGRFSSVPRERITNAPQPTPIILSQELHKAYHANLDDKARLYWYERGIGESAINHFVLGVCHYHPLWRQLTYTIPVFQDGQVVNIRHRLSNPPKPNDKYRPEMAGLPSSALFNGDILTTEINGIVIVAGEAKTIVLWQFGIPAISPTAGCGHWRPEWTSRLQYCKLVYITFDPKEEASAAKLADQIGERARIVTLPDKPDDFVLTYGADAFRYHLKHALPLAKWRSAQTVAVPERVAQALYAGTAPLADAPRSDVPWRGQLLNTGGKRG